MNFARATGTGNSLTNYGLPAGANSLLFACLLLISASNPPALADARQKNETVLVLHQKHRWLGKVIVYCNESHVRVASTESEAALIANAPGWRVRKAAA